MGFPSPAKDYEEDRLTVDKLCGIDMNCRVIETDCGWAVINIALPFFPGVVVLATFDGRNHFAKVMGRSLITEDGEAIEGDALDDVEVFGVLTHSLNRVGNDDCPAI
ncbi:hypothetical protein RZP48_25510 [Enterobacter asburiae]|uniref:DNA polymerase V n=1 Tax=Enterobacter asburiae TaxID=61645 RepID=A0AAW7ZV44_ENTAS|nr:hypothetical protein [Enterobacter asburiae]MCL8161948.1 hypothetical protein [Enterobacter asburiae]MCM7944155.1 hypothetical protein [Enterobacter asburiae]MDO7924253.1 hypothetical protein [Enterobacter asburiae]MDV0916418.1 hypothetical protein [Enterobacter asburiae]MDV0936363.1 hypothetical protein [Enterobacter asburiae]